MVKAKSVGQEREVMGQKRMQDCDQQVLVTHRACAAKVLGTELAARPTANGDRLTMASSRVFGSADALYFKPASCPIQVLCGFSIESGCHPLKRFVNAYFSGRLPPWEIAQRTLQVTFHRYSCGAG